MRRPAVGGGSPVGEWAVEATVPGGGTYTGRVIGRPVGATVELEWEISAGRYVGLGLEAAGDWYVACGEDWVGLGLALLQEDGGVRWSPAPGRGEVGFTRLVAAGARRWEAGPGTAPEFPLGGVSLPGEGPLLQADLTSGPSERGLALACPGGYALAWYPRFGQVVILRYSSGREAGTWEAVWGLGGHPDLAVETLRPRG